MSLKLNSWLRIVLESTKSNQNTWGHTFFLSPWSSKKLYNGYRKTKDTEKLSYLVIWPFYCGFRIITLFNRVAETDLPIKLGNGKSYKCINLGSWQYFGWCFGRCLLKYSPNDSINSSYGSYQRKSYCQCQRHLGIHSELGMSFGLVKNNSEKKLWATVLTSNITFNFDTKTARFFSIMRYFC